jgi:hypothetical protein
LNKPYATYAEAPKASGPVRGSTKRMSRGKRNATAIRLIEGWLADGSGYHERAWPKVKKAIEDNRLTRRRRFCEARHCREIASATF